MKNRVGRLWGHYVVEGDPNLVKYPELYIKKNNNKVIIQKRNKLGNLENITEGNHDSEKLYNKFQIVIVRCGTGTSFSGYYVIYTKNVDGAEGTQYIKLPNYQDDNVSRYKVFLAPYGEYKVSDSSYNGFTFSSPLNRFMFIYTDESDEKSLAIGKIIYSQMNDSVFYGKLDPIPCYIPSVISIENPVIVNDFIYISVDEEKSRDTI